MCTLGMLAFVRIRNRCHVLPSDLPETAQAVHVEVVGLSCVSARHCPGFKSIQVVGEHNGTVDLQLGEKADSSANPDVFAVVRRLRPSCC